MDIEILADADAVALRAASFIAGRGPRGRRRSGPVRDGGERRQDAVADAQRARGRRRPLALVHVFQVDERIAPAGDPDRNLTHLRESLLSRAPLPPAQIYAMPVEAADLAAAAIEYAMGLEALAGTPPVLDLVHLGLGPDGHTASLVPGDPVLAVTGADVALTGVYMGRRRMTLTFPVLDRGRKVLWLVTGGEKVPMLKRLLAHDPTIPAGRVRPDDALVLADRAAAAGAE